MVNMGKTKLILASGSAGRKSLLESLNLKFEVIESDVDEEKIQSKDPIEMAVKRAEAKGESVAKKIIYQYSGKSVNQYIGKSVDQYDGKQNKENTDNTGNTDLPIYRSTDIPKTILILAADTVGFMGDWIFNKPKSREEAEETLARLSGKTHSYVSAHCVIKISIPVNRYISKSVDQYVGNKKNTDNTGDTDLPIYPPASALPQAMRAGRFTDILKTTGHDISSVTFRKLTRDDICVYLDHIDYLKFCGAYKLSNSPQNFTIKTEGSISNIIGLSLEKIIPILKENSLL